jgi:5-methyltetrahydropteroyltriglutamate--homocysteine methyltransferase
MASADRADTVGSLLRPDYLVRARAQLEGGEMRAVKYKQIEDRAVDQVIAMQEGAGLDLVTD